MPKRGEREGGTPSQVATRFPPRATSQPPARDQECQKGEREGGTPSQAATRFPPRATSQPPARDQECQKGGARGGNALASRYEVPSKGDDPAAREGPRVPKKGGARGAPSQVGRAVPIPPTAGHPPLEAQRLAIQGHIPTSFLNGRRVQSKPVSLPYILCSLHSWLFSKDPSDSSSISRSQSPTW